MAKAIRFPLEMTKGAKVRTLEELRENFELETVLSYYVDGKLIIWLNDRYYSEEVAQIKELDNSFPDLAWSLCKILGVDINPSDGVLDLNSIVRRNAKNKILNDDSVNEEILILIKRNWTTCLMEITHFQTFVRNYIQCRKHNE